MLVDSHCHLDFPEFRERLPEIRAAMRAAGVGAVVTIGTTMEGWPRVLALAEAHAEIWATVGVHPDEEGVQEPDLQALVDAAAHPRVVAVGETGLDYYRLAGRGVAEMAWQRERFRLHVRAARALRKPLVIHTRAAADDTLALLREEQGADVGGVFHCFTESLDVARAALDLGFHLSFSGILSFKNAASLREVAAFAPLDRVLVETDSPYLAPVPHRGKTNQPAYVTEVARHLAAVKGLPLETVAETTTHNVQRLFGIRVPAGDAGAPGT